MKKTFQINGVNYYAHKKYMIALFGKRVQIDYDPTNPKLGVTIRVYVTNHGQSQLAGAIINQLKKSKVHQGFTFELLVAELTKK